MYFSEYFVLKVTKVEESVQNILSRSRSISPPDSTDLLSESLGSSSGNDLSSSTDSCKQIGNFSNSENSANKAFSLNYLGMISSETRSLSPAELDKLVVMMKERTVERQQSKSAGNSPTAAMKTAPVSKSPNLRTKRKKAKGDIGPKISVVSPTNEVGPRPSRSRSFNEKKSNGSPVMEKKKKHSLDAGQPLKGFTLLEPDNDLTSSDSPDGNIMVTANYDAVEKQRDVKSVAEDLTALKSGAELQVLSVDLPKRDVTLTLTKDSVILQDVADDKIIRKRNMTEIACCTQVSVCISTAVCILRVSLWHSQVPKALNHEISFHCCFLVQEALPSCFWENCSPSCDINYAGFILGKVLSPAFS